MISLKVDLEKQMREEGENWNFKVKGKKYSKFNTPCMICHINWPTTPEYSKKM